MTDLSTRLLLRQGAQRTVEKLQDNIKNKSATSYGPMNNTGEAAQSIKYRWVSDDHIQVVSSMPGRSFNYIMTLETGRGPGGFPPVKNILDWIQQRGINPEGITQKSLAFLIARRISREGSLLYRQGGNSGIISEVQTQEWIEANFLGPIFEGVKQDFEQSIRGI